MNSAFQKSSRRAIKSTITRFISITLISFLGAGVFAGLAATSPNMKRVGDEYYDQYNVMDVRMLSTYGFSDKDVEAIRNTDGVSGVMASYTVDAAGSVGDKDYTFRINGLSAAADASAPDYINRLKMIDGRWPENDSEAVIIRPSIGLKNIKLGSTVSLNESSNYAIPDTLDRLTYTVVGIAESPFYISFMQGNTSVGSGMIDYVLYVPQTNFIVDGYTDIYVTVKGAKELAAFEDAYFDHTGVTIKRLEALADERQSLRRDEFQADLADAKQEYSDAVAETDKKLTEAKSQLDRGAEELKDAKEQYADGLAEYNRQKAEAEQKLADAKARLEGAAEKSTDGESELAEGWQEYYNKKAQAEQQLADAKAQLDDAAAKIAEGEKELSKKQQEYNDKKAKADAELAAAKQKIENAEEKLSDLGEPKWYVLDRHMNEAFVTYEGDTERMRDLATVFPIVFFLVAALVCLTTMTRMVNEDRTLIGTFKALGYSNGKIAGRYLKYAASASFIGSIAGIAVGFWLIPTIVWGAYGIVFALPEMTPAFYLGIGVLSVFATVFITTLSTGIAAKNSLRESPADLMRPKAPKSGKRIFLEYVKPVWSRLTFTQKVTLRNLGLNKKRLLMSLVGIIGCTALVVTALGAKNAVRTLLDDQFGDIFHYNVTVGFNGESPSADLTSLLSDKAYFVQSTEVLRSSAEAGLKDDDSDTYNIYVLSPKEAEGFTDYVTLYDPEAKKSLSFTDDSAVITEKLSLNLNVGVGDTIWVKYLDEDERHPVKITGITTNYAFNYIYLGKSAYAAAFGEEPEYNQFLAVATEGHTNDEIKAYLSSACDIGAISFTDDLMGNIRTSINSVDKIIWVLIIAAGLLAFVVLYNLTNINIGERQRELATLKVLGFYDKETYSYIFRETIILSIIGCLAGLFAGIFLYRAVITTVEPDMILLTRDLTWQGYLGAAVLTMLFTWIVNQCMKPKIKAIDMLESLKSVD